MAKRYAVKIEGGDQVLVDIGGWGILAGIDEGKTHYVIKYVKIDYENGKGKPKMIPADVQVIDSNKSEIPIPQARMVRIWRHGE